MKGVLSTLYGSDGVSPFAPCTVQNERSAAPGCTMEALAQGLNKEMAIMDRNSTTSATTMVPATMVAACARSPSVAPAAVHTIVSQCLVLYCFGTPCVYTRCLLKILVTSLWIADNLA